MPKPKRRHVLARLGFPHYMRATIPSPDKAKTKYRWDHGFLRRRADIVLPTQYRVHKFHSAR
ncbi:MAG: hypothetical protein M3N13_02090 [Candidatus Eremiobacteraeota bacterium]|nr:hypothetical protein [Candidatus Eremiobacteraeota bacterium]